MHMNNTNRSSGSMSTGMIILVGAGEGRWSRAWQGAKNKCPGQVFKVNAEGTMSISG